MPSFSNYTSGKADTVIKVKPARIAPRSISVIGIVLHRVVKKDTGGPKAAKDPPVKYAIRLVKDETLSRFVSPKEKPDDSMDAVSLQPESLVFSMLHIQYIAIFGGPLDLRQGRAYEFMGTEYQIFKSKTKPELEPLVDLKCTQIKAAVFDVPAFLASLSYEQASLKWDIRAPSFFAMQIEQNLGRQTALMAARGWPGVIGRIALPDKLTETHLFREYGEEGKSTYSKEIGLNGGKSNSGYAGATISAHQSLDGKESGLNIGVQSFINTATFDDLMVTLEEWDILAPRLLPHATGWFFGEIDFKGTEAIGDIIGFDKYFVANNGLLRLDLAEMIRRAGVPIDWPSLLNFINPKSNSSPLWQTSIVKTDQAATIMNLMNVDGDFSSMEPAVEAETVKLYVLSNWNISDKEHAILCAMEMNDRVKAILGDREKMNLGYGNTQPLCTIYAIGSGMPAYVQPIQHKKKMLMS